MERETKKPLMASAEDPQTTTSHQPCENGCVFSSSFPATDQNLCSTCFNDYHLINEREKLPRIITLKAPNTSQQAGIGFFNHLIHLVKRFWESSDDDDETNDDLKNNCCEYEYEYDCDNKVGFFGSRCDCNGRFCVVHRLPEEHACKHHRFKIAGREDVRSERFLEDDDDDLASAF